MWSSLESLERERLLSECKSIGLPVNDDDKIKTLEMAYAIAKTNNWNYSGSNTEKDKIIDRTINIIRGLS